MEEEDYEMIKSDNFFEDLQKMTDLPSPKSVKIDVEMMDEQRSNCTSSVFRTQEQLCKMPAYDPNKSYESEYFKLFMENQRILEKLDRVAADKTDTEIKILKISDYYDQNESKWTIDRHANGRKIVIRKTRAELNCDFECPYSSCDKAYASEGSLNLHIKRKHNGGNKTDREKIAKSLLIFEAKGVRIDKELAVNLPPGIIRKVAEQIETTSNLRIKE